MLLTLLPLVGHLFKLIFRLNVFNVTHPPSPCRTFVQTYHMPAAAQVRPVKSTKI